VSANQKIPVAEDLQTVFDLDYINKNLELANQRLKTFSIKWNKKHRKIGNLAKNEMNEVYFTYILFNLKIWRIIYTTNWIKRLNKEFRRTFKIRYYMPSHPSALTWISKVVMDKEEGYMKYPIYMFKFDKELNIL
tara:strand:- start:8628 stop:9032 length:405 start_codon:yes stop_codon:yes gene_type:complete